MKNGMASSVYDEALPIILCTIAVGSNAPVIIVVASAEIASENPIGTPMIMRTRNIPITRITILIIIIEYLLPALRKKQYLQPRLLLL